MLEINLQLPVILDMHSSEAQGQVVQALLLQLQKVLPVHIHLVAVEVKAEVPPGVIVITQTVWITA